MRFFNYRFGEIDLAQEMAEKASILIEEDNLTLLEAEALWILGKIHFRRRNFTESLSYCEKAKLLAEKQDNDLLAAKCQVCIGAMLRVWHGSAKYTKVIDYYEASKSVFEANQDTTNLFNALYVLLDLYRSQIFQGKYEDKVIQYYARLTDITNTYRDDRLKLSFLLMGGALKEIKGEYTVANQNYLKAIVLSKAMRLANQTRHLYFRMAGNLMNMGEEEKALEMVQMGKSFNPEPATGAFRRLYFEILKANGQYEKAIEQAEITLYAQDSMYRNKQLDWVSEWETKYNLQEKNQALQQQQMEIKSQQTQNKFLLALIIIALLTSLIIAKAYLNQIKAKKALNEQKLIIEKQAGELKKLDKVKSRFFANVSHELRTPLTLILSPIQSILKI